jgi:hypothetical protein
MKKPYSCFRLAFALVAFALATTAGAASITAVGPAEFRAPAIAKSATPAMLLPPGSPAHRIELTAPTDAERAQLRAANAAATASRKVTKGLAIAFPRTLPADAARIDLAALPWQTLPDGTRAARLEVHSPQALATRVALTASPRDARISLRFIGNAPEAHAFGPVITTTIAEDIARFGVFWSPVLAGDVATIEIAVAAGAELAKASFVVSRIAHQVVAPGSLRKLDAKAAEDIGTAAPCEIDVACVTPQTAALVDADKAVAAIEIQHANGLTYLCTGQLLNDSITSNTPYLFSASHCIDSALAARTLNTFWFFDAIACGSKTVSAFVQQAAGSLLLARSNDYDWALVRLAAPPPAGVTFSAWRADPVPANNAVSVLHHPEGDLKKWSDGTMLFYQLYTDGSSFAQVRYSRGTTEPGSSGAGLLTFNPAGYYEVRGGLWSGEASCQNPGGIDEYSRIDTMLAVTRQYLTPDQPGTANTAVAVEYYNAALDHYFITISPAEIADLDSGVHGGWERTGLAFLAYQTQVPGTNPVCRFYRTPGFGDSHFYSASPTECQAVIASPDKFPGWTFESPNVFYIALPDLASGVCASGTQPIWRFFNQITTNHRYTSDQTERDDMRANSAVWIPEGYGPDNVIMCAPVGS